MQEGQEGGETLWAGREYSQEPLCSLKELDACWNPVGTGCSGDICSGGWGRRGPGQEVGEGWEVAQGCVNEKQGGVADPVSGPEQAGGRNGLSATQRER